MDDKSCRDASFGAMARWPLRHLDGSRPETANPWRSGTKVSYPVLTFLLEDNLRLGLSLGLGPGLVLGPSLG
jgi:hypothetical protein